MRIPPWLQDSAGGGLGQASPCWRPVVRRACHSSLHHIHLARRSPRSSQWKPMMLCSETEASAPCHVCWPIPTRSQRTAARPPPYPTALRLLIAVPAAPRGPPPRCTSAQARRQARPRGVMDVSQGAADQGCRGAGAVASTGEARSRHLLHALRMTAGRAARICP